MAAVLIDNEIYIKTNEKSYFKVELPENTLAWNYSCYPVISIYIATINKITCNKEEIYNDNTGIISIIVSSSIFVMVYCIFHDRIELVSKDNKTVYNFNFLEPMRNHNYFCDTFIYVYKTGDKRYVTMYFVVDNTRYEFNNDDIIITNINSFNPYNVCWEKDNKYVCKYKLGTDPEVYEIHCNSTNTKITKCDFKLSLLEDIISQKLIKYDGHYAVIIDSKLYKLAQNEIPYIITKPSTTTKSSRK